MFIYPSTTDIHFSGASGLLLVAVRLRKSRSRSPRKSENRFLKTLKLYKYTTNWKSTDNYSKCFAMSVVNSRSQFPRIVIFKVFKRSIDVSYQPLQWLCCYKHFLNRAMVVAQLVVRSLPIPEVRGPNPVIGKNLHIYRTFVYCQLCIEKTKINKKRPWMAHF